jgi:hypothetical protein
MFYDVNTWENNNFFCHFSLFILFDLPPEKKKKNLNLKTRDFYYKYTIFFGIPDFN